MSETHPPDVDLEPRPVVEAIAAHLGDAGEARGLVRLDPTGALRVETGPLEEVERGPVVAFTFRRGPEVTAEDLEHHRRHGGAMPFDVAFHLHLREDARWIRFRRLRFDSSEALKPWRLAVSQAIRAVCPIITEFKAAHPAVADAVTRLLSGSRLITWRELLEILAVLAVEPHAFVAELYGAVEPPSPSPVATLRRLGGLFVTAGLVSTAELEDLVWRLLARHVGEQGGRP